MKNYADLTSEDLEKMDKKTIIRIFCSMQSQYNAISHQLEYITEQIALMNQRSFGRKTEKIDDMQLTFDIFNEPESLSDDSPDPEITEVVVHSHTRKTKTKREEKLDGIPSRIIDHKIDEEKLKELFPNGYKELPCAVYKRLSIIPQTFIVDEHHVHIYASKDNDGTMVKADRPPDLFGKTSLATPPLVSTIITGKYQNHLPLKRQIQYFKDGGVTLEENTLANWMIDASDKYLSVIYNEMHSDLKSYHVVHADESPLKVIKKDDPDDNKLSYMWVYRTGASEKGHQIILFDYEPGRNHYHPDVFLKDFSGILVTDGYQAYHALERQRQDIKVAGCWVHAKRRFADLVKAVGAENVDSTISAQAVKKIAEIFHLDNQLNGLARYKRKKKRQQVVKPKVDDFFAWLKETIQKLPSESHTAKAINYCLNQEQYLRVFLSDPDVPMDNNSAERAIRPFTLGRKNWVITYSSKGARASAVLYSIVETAKANNLKVYEYINLVLSEMMEHKDDPDQSYVRDLLPWSEYVQEKCHAPIK